MRSFASVPLEGSWVYAEYVQRWATKEAADHASDGKGKAGQEEEDEADAVMSDVGSISESDDDA